MTATLPLSPIYENRFLNLELCRRKTVICRFRPSKRQQFAAGRSIDSDDALPSALTSGRRAQRPIAHKSETNSRSCLSPKVTGGHSTTRATLHISFKVKDQGHKLTSSVRLISCLFFIREKKMLYLCHYGRAGAYRVGRTWRPHSLLMLFL